MEKVAALKQKLKFLRKKIAGEPNIRIKTENPDKAFYQAALSRGDRRLGPVLLSRVLNDYSWRQAFALEKIDPDDYALRQRYETETFPWEIIDHGIERKYLWSEYQKALKEKTTVSCDTSKCKRCGVC